jgi:hypothetical protein
MEEVVVVVGVVVVVVVKTCRQCHHTLHKDRLISPVRRSRVSRVSL